MRYQKLHIEESSDGDAVLAADGTAVPMPVPQAVAAGENSGSVAKSRMARMMAGVAAWLVEQRRQWEYRKAYRELSALPDWQLKDMGIGRSDIRAAVTGAMEGRR